MADPIDFTHDGKCFTAQPGCKFLIETANGTSSYTLDRGFGYQPVEALQFYEELAVGPNQKKRLTMAHNGKRTIVARTK